MCPQKKKKLEAAIDNLFSSSKVRASQSQPAENITEPQANQPTSTNGMEVAVEQPKEVQVLSKLLEPASVPASLITSSSMPSSKDSLSGIAAPIVAPAGNSAGTPTPVVVPAAPPPAPIVESIEAVRENGEGVQMVIFTLEGQYYGINIEAVDSIIKMQPITELPHAPHFIVGLTNLRGKVLPVISLRKRFGLMEEESTKSSRIIVINVDQKEAGLIVDGVSEVETIPRKNIEPAPAMTGFNASRPIDGIAKFEDRLIILLNLGKVIIPVS
jgi:purine-binding chemotaxis protein CheW